MRRDAAPRDGASSVVREAGPAFYAELGLRIRRARQERQLTQQALASLVGLSRVSVANIEAGRQKMLVHTLADFAAALKTPVGQLLPGNPRPSSNDTFTDLRPEERSFVETVLTERKKTVRK